ncbi:MAG: TonB-dependent receptor domain-containing protein [Parcubacteria group bacterium]
MGASALAGALSIALTATAASAETRPIAFDLPAQPLGESLRDFYRESGEQIVFSEDLVAGRTSPALKGSYTADQALAMLLEGTNLSARRTSTGVVMIEAPQSGSAAGDGADAGTVAALVVTAQKREENIQDVPIAISAFTEKSLEEQKIEGGFDLLKAIPNVTFSKNNFTSYNFSIRGVGTKAISATTDPGVAVSFNNIALIQNRLFEQEYFDVERVEVLRGPQGTLYGRNATAGVINVISAKPNLQDFSGWIKGEVGNYHAKRLSAMVNVPLVQDKLAIRLAGSLTDRQGYDYNEGTHRAVNGRDLWSGRVTVAFNPTDRFRSNLIWERFNEDDNRSRTGKQLCHRDPGPTMIGNTAVAQPDESGGYFDAPLRQALFSQGCLPGSLYDDAAFGTPNGLSLPFIFGMHQAQQIIQVGPYNPETHVFEDFLQLRDPYGGMMQSRDLRVIDSIMDPVYRAKADVVELNLEFDVTDALKLFSQAAYDRDTVYSSQDYNRFNTGEIFRDSSILLGGYASLSPGGVFCDPQLGCSKSMVGYDISKAKSEQFSEEIRLQSSFTGPVNFSAGANYTRFRTLVDYYVFNNMITAMAMLPPFMAWDPPSQPVAFDTCSMFIDLTGTIFPAGDPRSACPYIDPNPLESINGEGHNYFRSKNPYRLLSTAAFGELYWQFSDALKVTAGLRYTDDRKTFTPVPSQVLLAPSFFAGGTVARGYPALPDIKQHWGEWTGRLGVDWKPELPFTDQTMVYAFYSRGYKGGGANPPTPGYGDKSLVDYLGDFLSFIVPQQDIERFTRPILQLPADYEPTFKPEFVNAFETGVKNTLLGGALVLNGDAFFYDYKDYQVSQIKLRTAVNENFDAKVWGLEFESLFSPSRNFHINANLGYLNTRIGNGQRSINIMDRTQGNPNYVLAKPWPLLPANCIVPEHVAEEFAGFFTRPDGSTYRKYTINQATFLCGGSNGFLEALGITNGVIDTRTGALYDPYARDANGNLLYPEINGGAGLYEDVSGNHLPNSPHWTMNIGAQYSHDILDGSWRATVRGDAYWQSQSWARVYNDNPYDKLHGWYNVNLSVWLERPEDDLKIEFYAKNLLDKTPITDAFLNSDDSALTTNVFTLDPRLIGLSIRKGF